MRFMLPTFTESYDSGFSDDMPSFGSPMFRVPRQSGTTREGTGPGPGVSLYTVRFSFTEAEAVDPRSVVSERNVRMGKLWSMRSVIP